MLLGLCLSILVLGLSPILLNLSVKRVKPEQKALTITYPKISVLLAVRNEVKEIGACLKALSALDYPDFEVLIVDDYSEDETASIVSRFIQDLPHFQLYDLSNYEFASNLKGKAKALEFLVNQAQGDYFALTDADVCVPSTWLSIFAKNIETNTGILAGITLPASKPLFALWQRLDWAWAFASILAVKQLGFATTAAGNNMLISRVAYKKVGGYETQEDSLTEDFAISQSVSKAGFDLEYIWQSASLAHTKAESDLLALWQQRKRWMHGAMRLPIFLKLGLILPLSWYPIFGLTLWLMPWLALIFLVVRLGLYAQVMRRIFSEIQQKKPSFWQVLIYDIWSNLFQLSLVVYYLLPIKVKWKGRKY